MYFSTTENKEIMLQARNSLKGLWGIVIKTMIVYFVITIVVSIIPFGSLFVKGALTLGLCIFSLSISRKQEIQLSQIFKGFKKYKVTLFAHVLQTVFILLWSLLLIVPGIIAGLSYSMTYFIIAEDDSISALEAINKSKEMMDGNKKKLFFLCFRFIGWILLSVLTLGIGFLWVFPYMSISYAIFYDDLLKNETDKNEENLITS